MKKEYEKDENLKLGLKEKFHQGYYDEEIIEYLIKRIGE